MDKAEELRLLGQLLDQGQPLVHQIVPMAAPSAPTVPPSGPKVIELGGKRYQVIPVTAANGQTGHRVNVEVGKSGGGTTWRTLNGYGKANKQNEFSNVIAAFKAMTE